MNWPKFRFQPAPTLVPTAVTTQVAVVRPLATPTALPSPTSTSTATDTPTPTPTNTPTPSPTSTPLATHTPMPTETSLSISQDVLPAIGGANIHTEIPPVVLANYFPWYDPETWSTGCTSAGDQPRNGVYQSDDPGVISRHIGQAQAAGLDGFAVHWFAPGNRTDSNFAQVLNQSPDGFHSTVTFLYHILPGINQQGVIDALRYVLDNYSEHPRFFRVGGKPIIIFSDMYRVPGATGAQPTSSIARWTEIRQAVDPDHNTWWIAEGLEPDYLSIFNGLYVYKIDHACCPNSYASAPRWAGWVRDWERQTGQTKLWIGTVMPGWNDLNSSQSHCTDLRVSSDPFARDRADGTYYAQTWEAVLPTQPDFVVLHSFNEWVEGSYIESSVGFGDLYMQLTAQWVTRFKSSR
ncbi:MAG: hypothetical protein GY832_15050 [Chloroflexi bacterium]|nr:hypothetical protein [Chloroflexota bacterium]